MRYDGTRNRLDMMWRCVTCVTVANGGAVREKLANKHHRFSLGGENQWADAGTGQLGLSYETKFSGANVDKGNSFWAGVATH